jgi:hypothetical protein
MCEKPGANRAPANTTDTTLRRVYDRERPIEATVVLARTPTGDPRRKVYLSESKAEALATRWRRRGWSVTVVRGVVALPRGTS